MSLLERRYRRTLRMLPRWYRERWEDEMAASFMEGAYRADPDPDVVEVGRPRLAERLSVAALALRLRLGGDGAPPRALAWREVWRRVALLTLLSSGAFAIVVCVLQYYLIAHGQYVRPDGQIVDPTTYGLSNVTPLFGLPWLVAFLLLVYGRLRWARHFAVTAAVLPLAARVVSTVVGDGPRWAYDMIPFELWTMTPAVVLVVLSIAAPTAEPAPSQRARTVWLAGFGLFLLVAGGLTAAQWVSLSPWDIISTQCALLVLGTLGVLAAGLASRQPSAAWLLALAVVGAGQGAVRWLTAVRIVDLELYRPIGTGVAIVTIVVAAVAAVAGLAALRREASTPIEPLHGGG